MKRSNLLKISVYIISLLIAFTIGYLLSSKPQPSQDEKPSFIYLPYANTRITYDTMHNIRAAHKYSKGRGIKVGILDHSFGENEYSNIYDDVVDFYHKNSRFNSSKAWHGFFMATTLREIAPEVEIYGLGTSSSVEDEKVSSMISAISWAINNEIDILTYSDARISEEGRNKLQPYMDKAHEAGILTVFIHHPDSKNILPADIDPDIPGIDNSEDFYIYEYDYSIYPGWITEEDFEDIAYESISSTAPTAAGIIALLLSANPDLDRNKIEQILKNTAYNYEDYEIYKSNVVDAEAAVKYVMKLNEEN